MTSLTKLTIEALNACDNPPSENVIEKIMNFETGLSKPMHETPLKLTLKLFVKMVFKILVRLCLMVLVKIEVT